VDIICDQIVTCQDLCAGLPWVPNPTPGWGTTDLLLIVPVAQAGLQQILGIVPGDAAGDARRDSQGTTAP